MTKRHYFMVAFFHFVIGWDVNIDGTQIENCRNIKMKIYLEWEK